MIAYFWNVPLITALLIHIIFEIFENTEQGMSIINNYFVGNSMLTWPGKKTRPDTFTNILGDNVYFVLGWIISKILDTSMGNHF